MTLRTKRSLRRAILCLAAAFVAVTLTAAAATINVPADQKTIQAGIDAASNGDTVLVAPGTYYENIDFKGKAITVTSGSPATTATTIIDGGSKAPAVTFTDGETRSSVLSYFTIQHGGVYATYLDIRVNGGILLSSTAPTILGNILTQNGCWSINSINSSPLIEGNTISATRDPYGNCELAGGAAILAFGDRPGLNTMIIGNTLEENVESGNEQYRTDNGGAGIAIWGGEPIIAKNIIRNNVTSGGTGAAIHIQQEGGGIDIVILQNLIYGNLSGCGGGALATQGASLIVNNTIVDNTYVSSNSYLPECADIAQIYPNPVSYGYSYPGDELVNNIIAGNTLDPSIDASYSNPDFSEAQQPTFDHNLFYNASGLVIGKNYVDISSKYGNIVADPQFVDQANHDYHLKPASPAIDAGTNSIFQSIKNASGTTVPFDYDGNARLQDATAKGYPIVDMGAYEYAGQVDASDTTVVLTSSLYYVNPGQNVVLTATFASALGTPAGSAVFWLDGKQIGTGGINSDGVATLTNFPIAKGVHSAWVTYAGSGNFAPAISVYIIIQASGLNTTSLAITSTPNPSLVNQAAAFTVTATSSDSSFVPSPISIYLNGSAAPLGTLTPDASGVATYTTSSLPLGGDTITASFAGDSTHLAASASMVQQVVDRFDTTTSLNVAPASGSYGTTISMSSAVNSSGAPVAEGGTLTFMDGATAIAEGEPSLNTPIVSFNDSHLAAGTHIITAVYSGDATHGSSTSPPVTVTISAAPTSLLLASSSNPAYALQPFTLAASLDSPGATGVLGATAAFFANGAPLGTAVTNPQGVASLTASLPAGTYGFTAVFAGGPDFAAATSPSLSEIVNPNLTTAAVYAQPNPGYQNGNETLTASILAEFSSSPATVVPTNGTVTFFDAGVAIATVPIATSGQASFSTNALTVGIHPITAVFNGNANFLPSTSRTYSLAILLSDFSVASGPSITIQTEHHKELDVTLASLGNFADTIDLACGNLPLYASCTFINQAPALGPGATLPFTLDIDTDAIRNFESSLRAPGNGPGGTRVREAIAIAFVLPVTLLATRRRRRSIGLFIAFAALALVTALTGCGGRYPGHTPPGTYTFTVTGQGAATHIRHTATVTLIVTE